MACCLKATSHYLNQNSPRSTGSRGFTTPQLIDCSFAWYDICDAMVVKVGSSWWLLVTWFLFDVRTAATIMMTWNDRCTSGIYQNYILYTTDGRLWPIVLTAHSSYFHNLFLVWSALRPYYYLCPLGFAVCTWSNWISFIYRYINFMMYSVVLSRWRLPVCWPWTSFGIIKACIIRPSLDCV